MKATIEMDGISEAQVGFKALANAPKSRELWRDVGIAGLSLYNDNFADGGKRFGGWQPLGYVAALLRRKPAGGKYKSEADVQAARKRQKPLLDTGHLRRSFQQSKEDNVIDVQADRLSVRIGTAAKYASLHDQGGMVTFDFDKEKQDRFWRNVAKKVGGKWNSWAFQQYYKLKKMHGKQYRVPARRIGIGFMDLSNADVDQIVRVIDAFMRKQAGGSP